MDVQVPCPCPHKADGEPRHTSDTVTLREQLDFRSATTIRKAIQIVRADDPGAGAAEVLGAMSEHYLLAGIERWTLTDDRNKPVEVSRTTIRWFLEHVAADGAMDLVDAADELYSAAVLLPLVARAQASSQPSQTDTSTSARTDSGFEDQTDSPSGSTPSTPLRPSRPSSTSTSRTADTATITQLPVGDSSSSRKAASAR